MKIMTLAEAVQRQGQAYSRLRFAVEGYEITRQKEPQYLSEAGIAVQEAQQRYDFNSRRVEQVREDEINATMARISEAREENYRQQMLAQAERNAIESEAVSVGVTKPKRKSRAKVKVVA